MQVIAILREALRQLEQANDFRRDSPLVADLRYRMVRAVAELEAAEAKRVAESGFHLPAKDRQP